MPPKPPTEDEKCSHIFPDTDPRAGERCTAFRRTNSTLCFMHDGGAKELAVIRQRQADRKKDLQEDLEYGYHSLRTLEDLQVFMEKTVNGVMAGFIKRDKAGLLAMFIPQLYKVTRDLHGTKPGGHTGNNIQINIGNIEHNKLSASLTPDNMDQFLLSDQTIAVKMIQDMQKDGKLKVEKRKEKPDIIDITAKELPQPEELKIDKKAIAKITNKTDLPLTPDQVEDLFGDSLGDTEGEGQLHAMPDMIGFGHIFEDEGVPIELRPKRHKWKVPYTYKKNLSNPSLATVWYECERCGFETGITNTAGDCPKADYTADYEAIGYEQVMDESMERTEDETLFD